MSRVENVACLEEQAKFRLRKRGKWTALLVEQLGLRRGLLGAVLGGRWRPDLTSHHSSEVASWLSAFLASGAKVVGGGLCRVEKPEFVQQPFVTLQLGDTRVNVLPRLLARLSLYSVYRSRTPQLLAALRTRGVEWVKECGLATADAALCLPGTLVLSYLVSGPEEVGAALLRTVEAGSSMGSDGFFHRLARNINPWVVNTRKSAVVGA